MRILVVHGPNLNWLGQRELAIYGRLTLAEIDDLLHRRAAELGVEIQTFQANGEGTIVDWLYAQAPSADGLIINPGALTHYGLSLRDALAALGKPGIEVHLSNVHAREEWRHRSVTAGVLTGQVLGLGWRGYRVALEVLVEILNEQVPQ